MYSDPIPKSSIYWTEINCLLSEKWQAYILPDTTSKYMFAFCGFSRKWTALLTKIINTALLWRFPSGVVIYSFNNSLSTEYSQCGFCKRARDSKLTPRQSVITPLHSEYSTTFVLTKRNCFTLVLVTKQRNSGLQNSDSQSSGQTNLIVIMRRASPRADQPLVIWLFCNWRISSWTSYSPQLSYNASEVFVSFWHSTKLHNISTVPVCVLSFPQHCSRGICSSGIRRCVKGVKSSRNFERHISFILKS
jgi:hypothetical protein